MAHIHVLDQITIDQIAAGEVIERPASVVKELTENALDAGASQVTVEVEDGGISLIRVADNGCGIPREEVRTAFIRHSTSKIEKAADLAALSSLGFRGEALSSICAVSRTEMITKTADEALGTRYVIEGGKEILLADTGAAGGTTFTVRQLFYNVPARRKFLKTAVTEAGHVQELVQHLALSHPETDFTFLSSGREKLRTPGSGELKDVIYRVFGRETAAALIPVDYEKNGIRMNGYIGRPEVTRGNRNFENFFVNGRYVRSPVISRALEDAFGDYVMQHKFPFAVLHFTLDAAKVDVNVHPTKMELRFMRQQDVYDAVYEAVHCTLLDAATVTRADLSGISGAAQESGRADKTASPFVLKPPQTDQADMLRESPIPYGTKNRENAIPGDTKSRQTAGDANAADSTSSPHMRSADSDGGPQDLNKGPADEPVPQVRDEEYFLRKMRERVTAFHQRASAAEVPKDGGIYARDGQQERIQSRVKAARQADARSEESRRDDASRNLGATADPGVYGSFEASAVPGTSGETAGYINSSVQNSTVSELPGSHALREEDEEPRQMDLFRDHLLERDIRTEYTLIGQVFDTYWLVEYRDCLYIIDQHAAHERVLYEETMSRMKSREYTSQYLSPPIILHLSIREAEVLNDNMERFTALGFEIEPFGGEEYAVRAVPDNLFSIAKKELLIDMLDEMADEITPAMKPELISERVASMSCKAAVKGNSRLSREEADALIAQLLTLDNPYHCPHGRPTIISLTKRELEKKFKRIV